MNNVWKCSLYFVTLTFHTPRSGLGCKYLAKERSCKTVFSPTNRIEKLKDCNPRKYSIFNINIQCLGNKMNEIESYLEFNDYSILTIFANIGCMEMKLRTINFPTIILPAVFLVRGLKEVVFLCLFLTI